MAARSPDSVAGITLSNPDRVLYPEQGITKRDLAGYYEAVADWILPHVANRPLSLVRCPRGMTGECFYQKHVTDSVPDAIHGVEIREEKGIGVYVMINDLPGLIALVQLGVLEMHPWGARADRIERPDRLVMDLDPGPGVAWKTLREAAVETRGVFDELGVETWLRTTGGKGLHLVAPIDRRTSWNDLKTFAAGVAQLMATRNPSRYLANMSKAKRRGKVYIDYLRNSRGATAVASYSTRARAGATVATPLRWDELSGVSDPASFNVESVPRRLAALKTDPWDGFFEARQVITKEMMTAVRSER